MREVFCYDLPRKSKAENPMLDRIRLIVRAVTLAIIFLCSGWCLAADVELPRKPAPAAALSVPIQRYGAQNPSCSRWTDGCIVCTPSGCSNIGIACQPTATVCTDPR
jgi:hypothetical protein